MAIWSPAAAAVVAAPGSVTTTAAALHLSFPKSSRNCLQISPHRRSASFSKFFHTRLQRTRTWSAGTKVVQSGLETSYHQRRSSLGTVAAVQRPYTAVMIVPTGTGASIGGFAGDSLPVARAMASVADCLVTHPNVLNGAMLYWPMPNALYVEGHALDKFAEGAWGLQPVHQNRVGLVLDAGMEEEMRLRHLQVADAACATLGLPILEYIVTDMPLQVEKWVEASGASTGRLHRPDSLMRAVGQLVQHGGVDAVAVVARFPDDSSEDLVDYRQGQITHSLLDQMQEKKSIV